MVTGLRLKLLRFQNSAFTYTSAMLPAANAYKGLVSEVYKNTIILIEFYRTCATSRLRPCFRFCRGDVRCVPFYPSPDFINARSETLKIREILLLVVDDNFAGRSARESTAHFKPAPIQQTFVFLFPFGPLIPSNISHHHSPTALSQLFSSVHIRLLSVDVISSQKGPPQAEDPLWSCAFLSLLTVQ